MKHTIAFVAALAGIFALLPRVSQGSSVAPNKLSGAEALARLASERDVYWITAKQETEGLDPLRRLPSSRHLCPVIISEGDRSKKEIALTFDDGPHTAYTPQILALLKRYDVKATFFVVGQQAERNPDLVQEEVADGHSVGNHTYHHVSLPKVSLEDDTAEIAAAGDVLKRITGKTPYLFRPPGGQRDADVDAAAAALGYTTVLWTDDPGDYDSPGADVILARTLWKAKNGGILLLHDGVQQTIDILPRLITQLQSEGYRFVTVDEMLRERSTDKASERRHLVPVAPPSIESSTL
jgi:peptidoglycan/xylan/chitin deacetylase (PgdA/CDA1 family)